MPGELATTQAASATAVPVPITDANLKAVAAAFKPADASQLARNQAALKVYWQRESAALFARIQEQAETRTKTMGK